MSMCILMVRGSFSSNAIFCYQLQTPPSSDEDYPNTARDHNLLLASRLDDHGDGMSPKFNSPVNFPQGKKWMLKFENFNFKIVEFSS